MATLKENLQEIKNQKDTYLLPENLKSGVTCLGITGTMEKGIDTSDANATSSDIIIDKTAYVNNEKVTGTLESVGGLNTNVESITPNTGYDNSFIEFRSQVLDHPMALIGDNITITMTPPMAQISTAINLTADKIKSGETILGITGTYTGNSSNVKWFKNTSEMNSDTTAQTGDMALVYDFIVTNISSTTTTNCIIFPEIVTLPEAFNSDTYYFNLVLATPDEFTTFSASGLLEANRFRLEYSSGINSMETNVIEYSSEDDITYNRIRFEASSSTIIPNSAIFGADIKVSVSDEWNNVLGYFMQIGTNTFNGLYKYDGSSYVQIEI